MAARGASSTTTSKPRARTTRRASSSRPSGRCSRCSACSRPRSARPAGARSCSGSASTSPSGLPGLFTRELPRPREGPGHVDARRARGPRRLGEPPPAQRRLVAAVGHRANRFRSARMPCALRLSFGSGDSAGVAAEAAAELGALARERAPAARRSRARSTRAASRCRSATSCGRRSPRTAARVVASPPMTTPPLQAQTAVRVVLVPVVVRAGEPGRRTVRVVHEIAEADDLRVGRRCRRTATPTGASGSNAPASPKFV